MNIVSFFSGCGGLDLGFSDVGFSIIWTNEADKNIWKTYEENHPNTELNKMKIQDVSMSSIPSNAVGIIGGPPCQSWSTAGKGRGIEDSRGKLFFTFIEIIKAKQPEFFVAENVAGMLDQRNREAFNKILDALRQANYEVTWDILDAADYEVPQHRKRLFFVGYRKDLGMEFTFPQPLPQQIVVRDVLEDIKDSAIPALTRDQTNGDKCAMSNHEYCTRGFSYIYMSRNRVLSWDKPSYTIQAHDRQVSIHPQAPPMKKVEKDKTIFEPGKEHLYRRLTIRECARLQTFPDSFIFYYQSLWQGYKMVGNAVPVKLSCHIAQKIYQDLQLID